MPEGCACRPNQNKRAFYAALAAFFAGLAIDFAGLEGVTEASQLTETMMTRLAWVYGPGLMCITFLVAIIYGTGCRDPD